MSDRHKKTKVVDGFTALKAAQRAAQPKAKPGDEAEGATPAAPPSHHEPGAPLGSRIGHTVLPPKHDITCYECRFEFHMTGLVKHTFCPRCRKQLFLKDYTIDGVWSEDIKTAGAVRIAAGGVLKAGDIIATDIILEGKIEGGHFEAFRWFEVAPGAEFDETGLKARDLRVAAGAVVSLKQRHAFRKVEVLGSLKGKLEAQGLVRVAAGGLLQGELHGPHLQVEEGGGLKARLDIHPDRDAETAHSEDAHRLRKTA